MKPLLARSLLLPALCKWNCQQQNGQTRGCSYSLPVANHSTILQTAR